MRCPRCEFENIPGKDKCFKCGSVLEVTSSIIDFDPPRMAKWKKPFRFFRRFLRTAFGKSSASINFLRPAWLKFFSRDGIFAVFISIIPGLSHLFQGRFREIFWYVLLWAVGILGGLSLYGSFIGWILFGTALGLHAWIAMNAGNVEEMSDIKYKLWAFVIVLFGFFVLYSYLGRVIFHNVASGHSNVTIPYQKIYQGDFLLANRRAVEDNSLKRGSLVLVPLYERRRGRRVFFRERESLMVVQIVGLGGEKLEIKEETFFINGIALEQDKYPVPGWLHNVEFSTKIPEDKYFINVEYHVRRRGINMTIDDVANICILGVERLRAKAFMLWLPLRQRGYIMELE